MVQRNLFPVILLVLAFLNQSAFAQLSTGWKAHDMSRPVPKVVTPGEQSHLPPSDAVVLFDGTDLSMWRSSNGKDEPKWRVVDGAMESGQGYIRTAEEFGDCQLHIEFASPANVKGNGQGRGNSGVYLMGSFEVQVLDSFENRTYADGSAGSIYGQHPPLVNSSRGPGQWQSYDIIFRRPRFDEDGALTTPAKFTVLHNGVLIQDGSEALGPTNWILHRSYESIKGKTQGPISLQDHGNPVHFRNIWLRRLEETRPGPETSYPTAQVELTEEDAQKLTGRYGQFPVKYEDGKLFTREANEWLELVPLSMTEFSIAKSAGKVTFKLDENGLGTSIEVALDAYGRPRKQNRTPQ